MGGIISFESLALRQAQDMAFSFELEKDKKEVFLARAEAPVRQAAAISRGKAPVR